MSTPPAERRVSRLGPLARPGPLALLATLLLTPASADAIALARIHLAWSVAGVEEQFELEMKTNGCNWTNARGDVCSETITELKRADGTVVPIARAARRIESTRLNWIDEPVFGHPKALFFRRDGRWSRVLLDGSEVIEKTDYTGLGWADVDRVGDGLAYGVIERDGTRSIAIPGEDGREAFRVDGVLPGAEIAVLADHVILFANAFPGESRVYDAAGKLLATHPGAIRRVYVGPARKTAEQAYRVGAKDWEHVLVGADGLVWPLDGAGQRMPLPAGVTGAIPVHSLWVPVADPKDYDRRDALMGWILRHADGGASWVETLSPTAKGQPFLELRPLPAAPPQGAWMANAPLWLHPIFAARRPGETGVGLVKLRRDTRELVPLTDERFADAAAAWTWLANNTANALGL